MAEVAFRHVYKTYVDGIHAVSDFSLIIPDGELFVLVGPSGCGKTTLLRMTAGLETISHGEICIDGTVINDLEPKDRDIAMVFQNYALYPHLSVFENIAFGLRARKVPRQTIERAVQEVAVILGLAAVLNRRPGQLSGGQRQRVAMGRAIIRQPKVYLLDEPLSNLDALLRVQMRAEIARLQREMRVTTLYVTHDQIEAMTIGHRLAVLRDGELLQVGSPQGVYDRPANTFVAKFIGSPSMNLAKAAICERAGQLHLRFGNALVPVHPNQLHGQPNLKRYVDQELLVGIRPEHIHLADAVPGHVISATVNLVERLGSEALLHLTLPLADIESDERMPHLRLSLRKGSKLPNPTDDPAVDFIAKVAPQTQIRQGERTEIVLEMAQLHAFDARTGNRI